MNNKVVTIALVITSGCALTLICIGTAILFSPDSSSVLDVQGTNTAIGSEQGSILEITSPTVTMEPTAYSIPTHTPSQSAGNLPGLTSSDITINLTERGFECSNLEMINSFYTWTCFRDETSFYSQIVVWSRTVDTIDLIDATVNQFGEPTDEIPNAIFGFISTMPYTNAVPDAARAWVESTLPSVTGEPGDIQTASFGGVEMRLYGPPTARSFEIGNLPTS